MNKQPKPRLPVLNDEFINDLAMNWYFLTLHFNASGASHSDQFINELIEHGIRLKRYLRDGCFTYLDPMNVSVDTETFFDVWLDADGDIQAGDLYTDED